jgi:hypothetical protein
VGVHGDDNGTTRKESQRAGLRDCDQLHVVVVAVVDAPDGIGVKPDPERFANVAAARGIEDDAVFGPIAGRRQIGAGGIEGDFRQKRAGRGRVADAKARDSD